MTLEETRMIAQVLSTTKPATNGMEAVWWLQTCQQFKRRLSAEVPGFDKVSFLRECGVPVGPAQDKDE